MITRFHRTSVIAVLASVCFTFAHASRAQESGATPGLFPVPPMQGKPWTPPETKLPPVVVDAIKELYAQGLADPRGCEYREVEVAPPVKTPWRMENTKSHAWVLPGTGGKRYAVGWNGRLIELAKVGAPVDLRKDFPLDARQACTGEDFQFRDTAEVGWGGQMDNHSADFGSMSETSVLPLKVALLLRLGEPEMAEGVWEMWVKSRYFNPDPYLDIAREWVVSWYNWSLMARMGDNRPLALQTFRTLTVLKKAVEESAARRKLPFPLDPLRMGSIRPYRQKTSKYYLEELQFHLPELLADEERRAKEPPYVTVAKSGKPAEGPARIAALIRDLEMERGEMWQPVPSQELVKEGDAAVEPLLRCLAEDTRLTLGETYLDLNTDLFGRKGNEPWSTVAVPAFATLTAILDCKDKVTLLRDVIPSDLSLEERKELAGKFRKIWIAQKGTTPENRAYDALKGEVPGEWIPAAQLLTQRTKTKPDGWPDTSSPMRGEALRAKTKPSVGDLLARRFNDLLPSLDASRGLQQTSVADILFALVDWDGKARAAEIHEMWQKLNAKIPPGPHDGNRHTSFNVTLCEKRLAAGDPAALADYTAWISSQQAMPDGQPTIDGTEIRILWEHPDDPDVRKAVEKMFAGKSAGFVSGLANTPMLGFPVFRQLVLKALEDKTIIGYARPYGNGSPALIVNLYESEHVTEASSKESKDFRCCDYCANELAKADVFPDFNLMWPEEKRDAAVAACKKLLSQYGDAFQYTPRNKNHAGLYAEMRTRPGFPQLDHPATPEDVAQGRAIFSLKGTVRVVPMPLPLRADRPSSKQDAVDNVYTPAHGEKLTYTSYTMDGAVWQAEEVLVDGKWQRYYGFAGRHQLERVPASEIEFRGGYPWVPFGADYEIALEGPQITPPGSSPSFADYIARPGAPLPMTVKLRRWGDTKPANQIAERLPGLPPIAISVAYCERIPQEIANPAANWQPWGFATYYLHFLKWSDVPQTAPIAAPDPNAGGWQFDLGKYFDASKPGSYRVTATIQPAGEPAVKTQEIVFAVSEK